MTTEEIKRTKWREGFVVRQPKLVVTLMDDDTD